jgi:hypothetical protein
MTRCSHLHWLHVLVEPVLHEPSVRAQQTAGFEPSGLLLVQFCQPVSIVLQSRCR